MTYQLPEPLLRDGVVLNTLAPGFKPNVNGYTAEQMLELRRKTIEEVIAMWEEPWGISQQSFSNRLRRLE